MTQADLAQGYVVDWGSTHIAECTNFSFGFNADQTDVTNHDSPNRTREFIAGLITPTEIALDVNYIPSEHDAVIASAGDSSTTDTLTLTRPANDGGFSMDAWVKGYTKNGSATGEADTMTITFQITGPISTGS